MRGGTGLARYMRGEPSTSGAAAAGPVPAGAGGAWVRKPDCLIWRGRAMATDVSLWLADAPPRGERSVVDLVLAMCESAAIFAEVEVQCTRFDDRSPLMRLNARPGVWTAVPERLYHALAASCLAWRRTGGRFDPRVLGVLRELGYDRALPPAPPGPAASGGEAGDGPGGAAAGGPLPPTPFLERRPRRHEVRLSGPPLDLGGIGKGLAVRWAARRLDAVSASFLVDAGGDCMCRGPGPEGDGWRLGVEDPRGGSDPVAVLCLRDRAVCTSSAGRRRWMAAGREVHHLIDPRTGEPACGGLLSVTVVGADAAWAEVWAKALFVEGAGGVGALAEARRLAALWVERGGAVRLSRGMAEYVAWLRDGPPAAVDAAGGGGGERGVVS